MHELTPLERAAIEAILVENRDHRVLIEERLRDLTVLSRENTGGGFFTEFRPNEEAKAGVDRIVGVFGQAVWMSIDGLDYGLGMILHLKDENPSLLEGYAIGAEDTRPIEFEHVRFAIAEEPSPLSATGRSS